MGNRYVVIEDFNEVISLVTDEEGNVKVFDTYLEAAEEAGKCQNGIVVKL